MSIQTSVAGDFEHTNAAYTYPWPCLKPASTPSRCHHPPPYLLLQLGCLGPGAHEYDGLPHLVAVGEDDFVDEVELGVLTGHVLRKGNTYSVRNPTVGGTVAWMTPVLICNLTNNPSMCVLSRDHFALLSMPRAIAFAKQHDAHWGT